MKIIKLVENMDLESEEVVNQIEDVLDELEWKWSKWKSILKTITGNYYGFNVNGKEKV